MPTTGIKPEFKTKPKMKSLIVKRSVALGGHKTSVSLKDAFWKSLKEIAASGKMTVSELLTAIDSGPRCGYLDLRWLESFGFGFACAFHRWPVPLPT